MNFVQELSMTEKLNVTIKLRKNTTLCELKEPRPKPMDADQQSPELISNTAKAESVTFPPYKS